MPQSGCNALLHRYCTLCSTLLALACPGMTKPSKPRRALDLIEPVVPHVLDDAVGDDDQARLFVRDVLVVGERRNVDEDAALPFERFGLLRPFPLELFQAIEFQIPVQVVAGPLDHEDDLLPHVAVLARAL